MKNNFDLQPADFLMFIVDAKFASLTEEGEFPMFEPEIFETIFETATDKEFKALIDVINFRNKFNKEKHSYEYSSNILDKIDATFGRN